MFNLWKWFGAHKVSSPPRASAVLVEANSPALIARTQLIEAIGIETVGGAFTPLLNVGIQLPCSVTKIFSTATKNQTEIELELYRGNKVTHVSSAFPLGKFKVEGIPPQPRGVPQIEIRLFTQGSDLMLDVRDRKGTGKSVRIVRVK